MTSRGVTAAARLAGLAVLVAGAVVVGPDLLSDRDGSHAGNGPAGTSPAGTSQVSTGSQPAGQTSGEPPTKPNIVVVMADDMRADDLVFTPRLRQLVAEHGVTFASSFSSFPLCCPTRATFMTGQQAHNHGVLWHSDRFGYGSFDDSRTLGTSLQEAGYSTAFIGKYLNKYGPADSLVSGESSHTYVPNGWTSWQATVDGNDHHPGSTYDYFHTPFNVDGETDLSHFGEYSTNVIGQMARDVVTRFADDDQPFFAYVNFVAPHNGGPGEEDDPSRLLDDIGSPQTFPTPARPEWVRGKFDELVTRASGMPKDGGPSESDVSDQPWQFAIQPELNDEERAGLREVTRQRAESMYVMDQEIRDLVRQLKASGEWDDTVFVFTSDNGYYLGEHRQRDGKVQPHEPSFRVPLLVTGPGLRAQRTTYDPASTVDLSATLIDLAGAEPPRPADGHSLVPTLYGADTGWTIPVLYESTHSGVFQVPQPGHPVRDPFSSVGVRTARYSYVKRRDGQHMLFDLARDPLQNENVARSPEYRDVAKELSALVRRMRHCAGEQCQVRLPPSLAADPDEAAELGRDYWRRVTAVYGF